MERLTPDRVDGLYVVMIQMGSVRCVQVVLKLIQPYTHIRIPFISKELNIPEADVEQLLVSLILDSRISGHIDQVRNRFLPLPTLMPLFFVKSWPGVCSLLVGKASPHLKEV